MAGNGTTNDSLIPVQVGVSQNATAIGAGFESTVVLTFDSMVGTAWAWGNNSNGQLGDGTTTQRTIPVQVSGLSDVTTMAAGAADTVALKVDNTVWGWGNNLFGQLGDGTNADKLTPVRALLP